MASFPTFSSCRWRLQDGDKTTRPIVLIIIVFIAHTLIVSPRLASPHFDSPCLATIDARRRLAAFLVLCVMRDTTTTHANARCDLRTSDGRRDARVHVDESTAAAVKFFGEARRRDSTGARIRRQVSRVFLAFGRRHRDSTLKAVGRADSIVIVMIVCNELRCHQYFSQHHYTYYSI